MDLKKLKEEIFADPELKRKFDSLANHEMSFTSIWTVEASGDSRISFTGDYEVEIENSNDDYDEDGNFIGMERVWKAVEKVANKLGSRADRVYSVEDDKVLYKE